ncbi:hypothetical protein [Streptacidiphilus carbonis]|uniref:hypothetical protein n=1 Tax=Streptacidiphilus carbonis TaxID=105422 RepID=UPI00157BB5D7|nr:hypothetical protein [Streptacidiphilus carbonis]
MSAESRWATAPDIVRERQLPFVIAGYEKRNGDLGLFAAPSACAWSGPRRWPEQWEQR